MFTIKHINYSDTGFFSPLILDYLAGKPELNAFYELVPQISSFSKKIKERSAIQIDRATLTQVLTEQNASLPENHKVLATIELLKSNTTFTVTTGHQLNLFTGPLYFIYKVISTINLAEKLKQEYPENNFVPVYWMHCEDHDFAEINHIHLFGKKIEWKEEHHGPAGDILTDSLRPVIDEVKAILADSENADELIKLFTDAYLGYSNLADAMRFLCHKLFGRYGLVILDARDARLKRTFIPQLKEDIFNNAGYTAVSETNAELEKLGYKTQVNPREINCFYLAGGKRERIVKKEKGFEVLNTSLVFSHEELEKEIEEHPGKFSPNVVLRPLYQEHILPDIAYIGGAGELAYWLQYHKLFKKLNTSFPILVLRNSVMVVDEALNSKIKKLGLKAVDFFAPEEKLVSDFIAANSSAETSLSDEYKKLADIFTSIKAKAAKIDTTLEASVDAELQKQIKSMEQVESRIQRAEKKKHETSINQLKTIREKLFPANELQERHENISLFYLRYGADFIEELKKTLDVFDSRFIIFTASAD